MRAVTELLKRIAELERRQDNMFRHGPVEDRKQIEGRWHVRLRIGGSDSEPMLSPWIPYSSPNGGPNGLNVHRVPTKNEQLTMLSPSGDFRQAVATSLFFSDQHPPPSDDADAVVITHAGLKITSKGGNVTIETSGELTLKANKIVTDGPTHLDKGDAKVVTLSGPAARVFAKT